MLKISCNIEFQIVDAWYGCIKFYNDSIRYEFTAISSSRKFVCVSAFAKRQG